MSAPRFNIEEAQRHFTAPLNNLNITIEQIKRDRKLAKIRMAGTYVGIVLGATVTAYALSKKQVQNNED